MKMTKDMVMEIYIGLIELDIKETGKMETACEREYLLHFCNPQTLYWDQKIKNTKENLNES